MEELGATSVTEPSVEIAADGPVPELVYVESSSSSESDVGAVEESESVFTEIVVDGVESGVAAALVVVTVASVVGEDGGADEESAGGLAT